MNRIELPYIAGSIHKELESLYWVLENNYHISRRILDDLWIVVQKVKDLEELKEAE